MSGDLAGAERAVARAPDGWQQPLGAWLVTLAHVQQRSVHTVCAYIGDVRQLAEHVGGEPADVDRFALRSWLAELHDGNASRASMRRKVSSARQFFAYALREGRVSHDPTLALDTPKRHSSLPVVPTAAQASALLAACDTSTALGLRTKALVELLYAAGLRCGEAVALTVSDVDLDRHALYVLGKGGRRRYAPFAPATASTLRRYLDRARPALRPKGTDALLLSRTGRALTDRDARRLVNRAATDAGMAALSPHSLRHGYATHLLDGGGDLRAIQELLGHASIASTQAYTRVSIQLLRDSYDAAFPRA